MDVMRGIRVVDLTMWAFVPSAGGVLAHWGADVIKVESPKAPDPMRLLGGTLEPGRASWYFKHYSRGKRSITLDLTTDEGRDILYRLVDTADVFLTSYLPDAAEAEDRRRRHPGSQPADCLRPRDRAGPAGPRGRTRRLRRRHLVVPGVAGRLHHEGDGH